MTSSVKWTRRGTFGVSGGEKWDAQVGNVELVVDGMGQSWGWKVSTIEGKYCEKQGEEKVKEGAMKKAEKAAVLLNSATRKESLDMRVRDEAKLPSEIFRDLVYERVIKR